MRNIDYFDKQATLHPDRDVLVTPDGSFTYAEMQGLSHRIAGAMLDAGLARQDGVAIMSPNDPKVLMVMLALWRADATWIPVNTRNAMADNIAYLTYVGATWLFYHSNERDAALETARQVPTIEHLVCLDTTDGETPSLEAFMRPEGSGPLPDTGDPHGNMEDLVALIATGGTTGPAKGVRVPNRSWGTMLETIGNIMHYDGAPVFLATAPLTTCGRAVHHGRHRDGRDRCRPARVRGRGVHGRDRRAWRDPYIPATSRRSTRCLRTRRCATSTIHRCAISCLQAPPVRQKN